jgi:malate synthase
MTDAQQVDFVRDTMRRLSDFQRLEAEVRNIYIDPDVDDPDGASAELRARRDQVRREVVARQSLAEAILQEQIEVIYREEGFDVGGQVWPPLRFRFTPLPYLLIISPRDRIERIDQRELQTGLPVDQQDHIERAVSARFDVSSLVTPIGGLGAYPTMIPETPSIRYAIDVAAHEWVHNYLLLSPVGLNYNADPVARVINETTASIVEEEIGRRVLERFYPDLAPQPQPQRQPAASAPSAAEKGDEPPPFDFRLEMRETRLRVDDLLAAGKIDAAESYMEERRKLFVENGYQIRKLNQAFFAFHGAYNAEPGGSPAAGRDPIGPAVQALRQRSASVGDFLRAIAGVRSLEDVERALR